MRHLTSFGKLLIRLDRLKLIESNRIGDEDGPDELHSVAIGTDLEGNPVPADLPSADRDEDDDDDDVVDDEDADDVDDQEDEGDDDEDDDVGDEDNAEADDDADDDTDGYYDNSDDEIYEGMKTRYEDALKRLPGKLTATNISEMVDTALSAAPPYPPDRGALFGCWQPDQPRSTKRPAIHLSEQSVYAPPEPDAGRQPAADRLRSRRIRLGCDVLRVGGITFAMLIAFALYLEQLTVTNERPARPRYWTPHLNANGSIWAVQVTLLVMSAAVCGAWAMAKKLTLEKLRALVKPWINWRMLCVSCLNGATTTLIFVCSYERVACHLQDPFKGFCLAFAIVFYFLICKRVMGLPKIFAATTAVVGLLIAVDYGMCDSYRCRGLDVPAASESPTPATGWQSRAIWAMVYIGALALWTLQWSLLENVLIAQMRAARRVPDPRLMSTISHVVARRSTRQTELMRSFMGLYKARLRRRPDALLLVCLMHVFALPSCYLGGAVDMVQMNGTPSRMQDFIYDSMETIACHVGQCGFLLDDSAADGHFQLPAENSPANETGRQRRSRRSLGNGTALHETVINGTVHLMVVGSEAHRHHVAASSPQHNGSTHSPAVAVRKINTDKLWQKYKNFVKRKQHQTAAMAASTGTTSSTESTFVPLDVAANSTQMSGSQVDYIRDWSVLWKTLLFCVVYLAFLTLCLQFLIDTQSAVFVVASQSLALPIAGVFWSLFEMKHTAAFNATFVWAPEVTGELICSVLGLPIVLLGLTLFGNAHLDDVKKRRRQFVAAIS